jgi:hypothetical protein
MTTSMCVTAPLPTGASLSSAPARRAKASAGMRPWQAMVTGLALTVSLGAQSFAAAPSLQGRWTMVPAGSSFEETVTGPRPDAVTMSVTRDDPARLTYELVESRGGEEVARGDYDLSLSGAGSTSSVDGAKLNVVAEREPAGDIVVLGPRIAGAQAAIRVRLTGPDSAVLEHEVSNDGRVRRIETISLVRAEAVATR